MVTTRFWSDSFIVDQLNALDRYLFLYLLTNERANIIGIYELSLRTAAFETGIDKDDLTKMLGRLSPKVEYFDGWVYIRKFADHQTTSPKVEIGMEREVRDLPADVQEKIQKIGFSSARLQLIFHNVLNGMEDETDGIDTVSEGIDTTSHLNLNLNSNLNSNLNLTKPSDNTQRPATAKAAPVSAEMVNELFSYWHQTVGTNIQQTKTGVDYAKKLYRDHGMDGVKRLIDGAALALEDQYAPRISNFNDLYLKKDRFLLWGRKRTRGNDGKPKIARIS